MKRTLILTLSFISVLGVEAAQAALRKDSDKPTVVAALNMYRDHIVPWQWEHI